MEEGEIDVVFFADAPYDDASLPDLCRLAFERMRVGFDGCVAGELERRGAFALELGESVGDGDCAAHASTGDEANDGSVAGRVDGGEVWAFEA